MKTICQICTISGLMTLMALSSLPAPAAPGQNDRPAHPRPSPKAETPAVFQKTLGLFLDLAARDQILCSLLGKHRLTLQYTVKDLGIDCHVGFDGRKVVAALGRAAKSQITIASDSATLDRMLRGGQGEDDVQVKLHLGVFRKFKLSQDLNAIKAALSRTYTAASEMVQAEVSALTVSAR